MYPIAATGRLTGPASRQRQCHHTTCSAEPAKPGAASRALVPVTPPAPAERVGHRTWSRPSAAFLAQLIAAHSRLPQARERRRAEPHQAIAAYTATARAA